MRCACCLHGNTVLIRIMPQSDVVGMLGIISYLQVAICMKTLKSLLHPRRSFQQTLFFFFFIFLLLVFLYELFIPSRLFVSFSKQDVKSIVRLLTQQGLLSDPFKMREFGNKNFLLFFSPAGYFNVMSRKKDSRCL